MNTALAGREAYQGAFARRQAVPAQANLARLRHDAWERLGALGLPHVRLEDWRFTNPAPITQGKFVDGRAIVTVSGDARVGGIVAGLEDKALGGPVAAALGQIAAWQERAFVALNTAMIEDGALVHVPRGVTLEEPVRITYTTAPDATGKVATHPRALVLVEAGARVTVIEDFRASQTAGDFVNAVIEFELGEGAMVEHISLLDDAPGALHVGAAFARLAKGAHFASRSITLGGRLSRRDIHVTFAGPGGVSDLDGLYVTSGDELVDHHTTADHAVPECSSRELFKGVLGGASRAVFNGAVIIRPGAQKSDAGQQNQNLLLSVDAVIDTKPELQIFADDVKCSHGATVGQLDDDALFYLRTRGIDAAAARAMLTHAFAREIVNRIGHAGLRADVDAMVERRMEALTAQEATS